MTKLNIKVISGGATGADEAGLLAAYNLGLPTGGTAPKDYRILLADGSDSTNPELKSKYGLTEHKSYEWTPRTIQNVVDSEGTVWFGYTESGGGKLTIGSCIEHKKPYLINPSSQELANWIKDNNIEILNVSGNIVSKWNPDIFMTTYNTVFMALSYLLK